jgi:general secretion pathway protein A
MYLTFFRFFGLRENPFNGNPDPGYLFLNQQTQSILEDMASAIQARKGLIVLTGEVGTGKTTLINRLKHWLLQQGIPTAFIFNPHLEVSELFDLALAGFGISSDTRPGGRSLIRLNQWLVEGYRSGTNAVLIIDEAQGLPIHVIEEIRMLLNQETPHEKLLQIVLVGQPELAETLRRANMRQIRQRISLHCQTKPLTREETHRYIEKRLRVAGGGDGSVFMPEAIDDVYLYSRGIPRVMNLLCEHALIRASLEQIQPVPAYMVTKIAREMQLDDAKLGARGQGAAIFPRMPRGSPELAAAADDSDAISILAAPASDPPPMAAALATSTIADHQGGEASFAGPRSFDATSLPTRGDPPFDLVRREVASVSAQEVRHASAIRQGEVIKGAVAKSLAAPATAPAKSLPASTLTKRWSRWLDWEVLSRGLSVSSAFSGRFRAIWPTISRRLSQTTHKLAPFWASAEPEQKFAALLRWLQAPLPSAKVHRRVHHPR